jgi:steroid Delta-isomerase
MTDAADIAHTVDQYIERFSAGDRAGWLDLWAPDATMEDPVGTPVKAGHDEIGGFFDESRAMADVLRLVRTGPVRIVAGEAAFPFQARPTIGGTEFCVDIIDVMTFTANPDTGAADTGAADAEAGSGGVEGEVRAQIATMRAFWDPATMRPADD